VLGIARNATREIICVKLVDCRCAGRLRSETGETRKKGGKGGREGSTAKGTLPRIIPGWYLNGLAGAL